MIPTITLLTTLIKPLKILRVLDRDVTILNDDHEDILHNRN